MKWRKVKQYFRDRPYYIKRAYNDAKLMWSIIYASNKMKMDKIMGVKKNEK